MATPYLRNIETGGIFIYTDMLAQQPWMQPCASLDMENVLDPAVEVVEQAKARARKRSALPVTDVEAKPVE
jgi:hypothetical protein